jgi:formylglycine-generating enzyme required for sulfatase activity
LSEQEGIAKEQWCYETDVKGQVMRLRKDYLSLTGYRLPTEAEWEYACRAGAVTSRSYGETAELLGKYGWYEKNSKERAWPVGSAKPNDLGLFDLHGNVWNWCQEVARSYPGVPGVTIDDKEDTLTISSTDVRMVRGGSFVNQASSVRSANRYYLVPSDRYSYIGFRPSRTLRPGPFTALPPTAEEGQKQNTK